MKSASNGGGPPYSEAPVVIRRTWAHVALLIVIATAITYPCIRRGLPAGHDSFTHLNYQHFFDAQIAQGERYPRWMPGLNRGLGGGIFFAQYPLPYYVAWGIGKIVPNRWGARLEARTQGLALVLATMLAALFTYTWCATFSDHLTAMLAAIIYLTLPYFVVVDLYMRASVGEFWALSFLPLSFFFIERVAAGSGRAVSGLAVAFALVIMSHLFTAVLLAPALVAYAIWRTQRGRRALAAARTLAGLGLAIGLAGVYTIPFWVHSRYFHPGNVLLAYGANYCPLSQLFSYNALTFPGPTSGWYLLAVSARVLAIAIAAYVGATWFRTREKRPSLLRFFLALVPIMALVLAATAGCVTSVTEVHGSLALPLNLIQQRAEIFLCTFLTFEAAVLCHWSIQNPHNKRLANILLILALASYVMMTSWSQIVWKNLHFLWAIQFPWRLNEFLAIATAGLAALAISELRKGSLRRWRAGRIVALAMWGFVAVQSACIVIRNSGSSRSIAFDDSMDFARPIYSQVDPRQALLVKPPDDEHIHASLEHGFGFAAITFVQPRSVKVHADCETACTIEIGQFYYPAWRVRGVADAVMRAGSSGGLMEVSIPAGEHDLDLELPLGWSERFGAWLSLACLLLVLVVAIAGLPRPQSSAV
jgi:hypothetical protein